MGLTALAVSTRAPTWKYLSDPDSALLLVRLVREMGVLARALGIAVSDRSILPVASICSAFQSRRVEGRSHRGSDGVTPVGRQRQQRRTGS